jgi:hypothetical protein
MEINVEMIHSILSGKFDMVHRKDACHTILDLLGYDQLSQDDINIIPGKKGVTCHKEAVFISLSKSPSFTKFNADQIIPLSKMLPLLFQQVLIDCLNINQEITLMTDTLEMNEFNKWEAHFNLLRSLDIKINIFFIGGKVLLNINDLILS